MPLLRGIARTAAIAGTATAVSNRVSRRQGQRWQREDEEQYAAQAPQGPPPPAEVDPVVRLKELAGLRDQGILTEDEFVAEKTKILAAGG